MRVVRGISVKLKSSCVAIGVCHLVLLFLSLYERVWELIKLEEPFLIQDHTTVLVSHVAQVISILLLLFGSVTGKSGFVVPWLICTAPLYLSGTLYAILYVSQEETSQVVLNLFVVVLRANRRDRKMTYLAQLLSPKEKSRIYFIAVLHCVMVCIGIWSLVMEMIDLQEPITSYDLIYSGIHYAIHIILIFCLFIGAYIDIPFFLIPWLSATFLVFLYVTALTIMSLVNWTLFDILIHCMNFGYLGICWLTWYGVFSYLATKYRLGKLPRN